MKTFLFAIPLLVAMPAWSQSPISTESIQLQQLVNTSKQQLKATKDLLDNGKRDADQLEKSSRALERLSSGIERSIEKYQGTAIYEKALLKLQSDDLIVQKPEGAVLDKEKSKKHFEAFQSQSIQANLSDLSDQQKLSEALRSAEQGFIPKIQTQTELGSWQSNTRVSSQLTELLSAVRGLREDLGGQSANGLVELVQGADTLNRKQREVKNHGPQ